MATKSETRKLVELYGRNYGAVTANAPLSIQQRFHKAYLTYLAKLESKYGGIISESDLRKLEQAGESWWKSKAMRGPGVDW